MTMINLENVGLVFHVRRHGRISLKEYLLHGLFRRPRKTPSRSAPWKASTCGSAKGTAWASSATTAAGKSTLLKLVAGIYPPASGRCTVQGKVSSLFELSLGFEPDASGWDNIKYRGYLQGETPRTIRAKWTTSPNSAN